MYYFVRVWPLVVVAYFSHVGVAGGDLTLVLVYRIVGTRLVYILGISMNEANQFNCCKFRTSVCAVCVLCSPRALLLPLAVSV